MRQETAVSCTHQAMRSDHVQHLPLLLIQTQLESVNMQQGTAVPCVHKAMHHDHLQPLLLLLIQLAGMDMQQGTAVSCTYTHTAVAYRP